MLRKRRAESRIESLKIPPRDGPKGILDYQPETRSTRLSTLPESKAALREDIRALQVKKIELIKGIPDITGSLTALTEKFSLDSFTLATSDGLVFATSGSSTAQTDAAVFSGIFATNPRTKTAGVQLFGLHHKGSNLVCVIRTNNPVPDRILQKITTDTQDILNWWI